MKEFLKKLIEKILPIKYQLNLRYFYLKKNNKLDDEMFYVSKLLEKKRRFLDIGANVGIYSFYFKNIFKNVDAFEPLKEITHRLHAIQNNFLKIHNVALSNKSGKLQFFIPYLNGKLAPALASLERRNNNGEIRTVEVKKVDDYNFRDVDLIKIDVEGHEQSVIEGALKTINTTMPVLIVEIEQRHIKKEINEVFQSILKIDYKGFFLQKGKLIPLNEFEYQKHQEPFLQNVNSKEYINNFIFIPNFKIIDENSTNK